MLGGQQELRHAGQRRRASWLPFLLPFLLCFRAGWIFGVYGSVESLVLFRHVAEQVQGNAMISLISYRVRRLVAVYHPICLE